MNLQQLLALITTNLAEYCTVFAATLAKPSVAFQPIAGKSDRGPDEKQLILSTKKVNSANLQLNPKLLSFVAISIFIGITVNGLIPDRIEGLEIVVATIVVMGLWLVYSSFIHQICIRLGGQGTYLNTMSVSRNSERRTETDWATEVACLMEGRYADCDRVILTSDNLNTHTIGAFYETFEPERARQLVRRY